MAAWTLDAQAGLFRGALINSSGQTSTATAFYDPDTKTWYLRATTVGSSNKQWLRGHVRFLDANTKKEHWTVYGLGGLIKTAEIEKTEVRRP